MQTRHTVQKSGLWIAFVLSVFVAFAIGHSVYGQSANTIQLQFSDYNPGAGGVCLRSHDGVARGNPASNALTAYIGDSDNRKPDCIRVSQGANAPAGTDVRICIQAHDFGGLFGIGASTGAVVCGPWAGDGGGWSPWSTDADSYDPDEYRIRIETRALSGGRQITDMRAGVQFGDMPGLNNGGCSNSNSATYTAWVSGGGGWSAWHSDEDGIDPNCLRIRLQTTVVCNFNGAPVVQGNSVTAYAASSVPFGSSCASEARTCGTGGLSGSYGYSSCSVNPPANCSFNGSPVAHGASVTAYQLSVVPFGSTCTAETRSCWNGGLSGSYGNPSCSVTPPANCTFNGSPVTHGSSVTAYQLSSVPNGSSCVSETRSCWNGGLSGSYGNSSCVVQNPNPPVNLSNSCNAAGDYATMYWNAPAGGATSYFPRIDPVAGACPAGWTKSTNTCLIDWVAATNIGFPVTPSQGYNWWVHAYNGSGIGNAAASTLNCPAPPPTVTVYGTKNTAPETSANITLSPITESITNIRWASTNSTSCSVVSGPADFAVGAVNGSDTSVTSPAANTSTTFTVSCTGLGGTIQDSIVVTTDPYPPPTAVLEVRNTTTGTGWLTTSPFNITAGDQIEFQWSSTNAVNGCTKTFIAGIATSGNAPTITEPVASSSAAFSLVCTGGGGTSPASRSITVNSYPAVPFFAISDTFARIGDTIMIAWNTYLNTPAQCSITGPGAPGTLSAQSGNVNVTVQGGSTYTITCPGGSVSFPVHLLPGVFES